MRRLGLLIVVVCCAIAGLAQGRGGDATISGRTASMRKIDGFIPLYWDAAGGKMWMEISRFDTELLYCGSLPAGVGSNPIGLDRGQLGE